MAETVGSANPGREVLGWFIALGMSPLQAQIYACLFQAKGMSVGALEDKLGAETDSLSKALMDMEKNGVVRKRIKGETETFLAIEPEMLIEKLLDGMERKVQDAKESSKQILIWLSSLTPSHPVETTDRVFRLLSGPHIFSRMLSLTGGAKKEILRIGSPAGLQVNLRLGLFEAERDARMRGVDIRAIVLDDPLLDSVVDAYSQVAKIRMMGREREMPRVTIIDGTAILFTSLPTTNARKHVALWTDNRFIVDGFRKAFRDLWNELDNGSAPAGNSAKKA
jgi:DNA-binding MarR family transcriptional regulator